ncbi:hypothetical protein ACLN6N_18270 (plasmid) [Sphingomonas carotinifaciens]|uniref:hypothetical protein n=2 Tax=Sphingomonas TaxID=13687 RepID=UPI00399FAEB8
MTIMVARARWRQAASLIADDADRDAIDHRLATEVARCLFADDAVCIEHWRSIGQMVETILAPDCLC